MHVQRKTRSYCLFSHMLEKFIFSQIWVLTYLPEFLGLDNRPADDNVRLEDGYFNVNVFWAWQPMQSVGPFFIS